MRLLLAEDDPMNIELFMATLEDDGHEVIVERDGKRAYARALAERFDALILDIQLPGMDGVAICHALREAGQAIPVLAVTALALHEQVERGRTAGFTEYLTKPISPSALRAAVRRHTRAA